MGHIVHAFYTRKVYGSLVFIYILKTGDIFFIMSSLKYRLFCFLERISGLLIVLWLWTSLRLWFSTCYHCKIDGSLLVCCSLQRRM